MPRETNGCSADRVADGLGGARFDYDCLPSAVAKFLKGQADRIKRHCVSSNIQIGKALLEAKRHLSHGEFLRWVESEVGLPVRTAQAYMRIANWAVAKGATVAHLKPSALYLLAASSTPEEFVADVLSRTGAGEFIPPSVLRRELASLREGQQLERAAAERVTQRVLVESEESIGVTVELVKIFMRGLSEADFARVRYIATSDAVLSDPEFAKNLARAFQTCAINAEAMRGPISSTADLAHQADSVTDSRAPLRAVG
jgi:hypothetical protein